MRMSSTFPHIGLAKGILSGQFCHTRDGISHLLYAPVDARSFMEPGRGVRMSVESIANITRY